MFNLRLKKVSQGFAVRSSSVERNCSNCSGTLSSSSIGVERDQGYAEALAWRSTRKVGIKKLVDPYRRGFPWRTPYLTQKNRCVPMMSVSFRSWRKSLDRPNSVPYLELGACASAVSAGNVK
jgi:hypothetical protein